MFEITVIVTLMTGDVMHAELLHGDIFSVENKIRDLEKGHTILHVSLQEVNVFLPEAEEEYSDTFPYLR